MIAVPVGMTAWAFLRPAPIIVLVALIAWLIWTAYVLPKARSSPTRQTQGAIGTFTIVGGAVLAAWAAYSALGQSMAPGRAEDPKYLVAFLIGLFVMGAGIFLIATRAR